MIIDGYDRTCRTCCSDSVTCRTASLKNNNPMGQRFTVQANVLGTNPTDNYMVVVLQSSSNRLTTIAINSGLAGTETFQQVSEILIHLTGFGCGVGRECMWKALTHCRNRYESQTKKRVGMNPRQRKEKDTKNVFLVFISAPFMVLLPVVGIPRPLIPDQSSSSSGGGCVVVGSSGSRG